MNSESSEMTGIRYRSAADCAMRKEKDVNCVARRRNKSDYCPAPPRDSFNRKKTHYSQPVLSLALKTLKYARPQHSEVSHMCL